MNILRMDSIPNHLLHQFVALLLFRCGGEQSFTPEDIREIQQTIGGISISISKDYKITLRARSHEATDAIMGEDSEPLERDE